MDTQALDGQAREEPPAGNRIPRTAVVRFLVLVLLLVAVPFLAAGRIDWWGGWAYVILTVLAVVGSRALILRFNPDLAAERATSLQAEGVKRWDRVLVPIVGQYGPLVTCMVGGLDVRFGWTGRLPFGLQLAGLAFLAAGSAFATWAMISNRFFSAMVRIQTDRGHSVVSAGPYRWIRHPGYAGGILADLATPLLLGSYWALFPGGLTAMVVVLRTALEDRTLLEELPGYTDYARRTRYRLLPGVW